MAERDWRVENKSKLNGRNKSTVTEMMNGKIRGNNEKKKNRYTIYKIITLILRRQKPKLNKIKVKKGRR